MRSTALTILPIGVPPAGLARALARFLGGVLGLDCSVPHERLVPHPAYRPFRGQYDATDLLERVEAVSRQPKTLTLGLADVDLFAPVFTFVFGAARLDGRCGIISTYRLRPSFVGLEEDPLVIESRARREALHELGHMMGLHHCPRPTCPMAFSAAPEEIDLKFEDFCPSCGDAIGRTPRTIPAGLSTAM